MRSELIFQTPYWFIVFCLAAGAAYAYFLYQPVASWGKKLNYLLAFFRGFTVSLICFLLLSHLVRKTETSVDKAKIVFAIDNSESVKDYGQPLMKQIAEASASVESGGFEVSVQTLDKNGKVIVPDSIHFNQNKTDLSGLLETVKSNFEGRNLTDVILLSDG